MHTSRALTFVLPLSAAAALAASDAFATEFHVSPTGAATNDGSAARPWDLTTALSGGVAVLPGDTVWLHEGRYGNGGNMPFDSRLNGTEAQPIVVRQARGERATIDGGVTASGTWTWLWGFEITNSGTDRNVSSEAGSPGARLGGLNLYGRGNRAINLVVHDTGHPAIGFWAGPGDGAEVYGCMMFGNGIYDPTFPPPGIRGNGTYAQNQHGERRIEDCISFRNFTEGVDATSDGVGYVNGFTIQGNTTFDNPRWNIFTQTRMNPMERQRILENYTYRRASDSTRGTAQFGYYNQMENLDIEVRGNYFVMGSDDDRAFFLKKWRDVTVTDNTFVSNHHVVMWDPGVPAGARRWDANSYFVTGTGGVFIVGDSVTGAPGTTPAFHDFAQWQAATGFDGASTFTRGRPSANRVFVRRNRYEPERANVTVYNWEMRAAVELDVSALLRPGQDYEVRDAQNYFGPPVARGTYAGGPLSLPMNLTEVAPIVGMVTHYTNRHTAPEFGVFVLTSTQPLGPGDAADAGVATDAGADARVAMDAGPDARTPTGLDGGAESSGPGGGSRGGCGCTTPRRRSFASGLAWTALAATAAHRRRRLRRRSCRA